MSTAPKLVTLESAKTYATRDNAIKAVDKKFPALHSDLRYFITCTEDGRFFPVFIGHDAVRAGIHFHFCVVG